MNRATYERLRAAADDESLSYGELAEIEAAFATIPDSQLSDRRENAMAEDMLDEIERLALTGEDGTPCIVCGAPILDDLGHDEGCAMIEHPGSLAVQAQALADRAATGACPSCGADEPPAMHAVLGHKPIVKEEAI